MSRKSKLPEYRDDGYPLNNKKFDSEAKRVAEELEEDAKLVDKYIQEMEESLKRKSEENNLKGTGTKE